MKILLILLSLLLIIALLTLIKLNVDRSIERKKSEWKILRYVKRYERIYEKGFLRNYYKQLKDTIYLNELLDEINLSRRAFFIMTRIIMKVVLVTLLYLFIARDAFVLMAIPLAIIIFKSSVVKYLRSHDLQMALRSGIELYKNRYNEFENCKIALASTINEREGTIKRHLELLYSLIDAPSEKAKERLNDYFLRMPNDHLQLIAMNNHIAYFEGDREENGESVLIQNTQSVINQMRSENTQREKFFREIKTDNIKMLSPIILLPLIRVGVMKFAEGLPETGNFMTIFYNGFYGQIVVAFILLFMLFSYNVHSKFIGEKYLINMSNVKVKRWMRPLIKVLAPNEGSRKQKKVKEKIIHSGSVMTVNVFYQRKVLTSVSLIVFSVLFIGVNHRLEESKILNNLLYSQHSEVYYRNLEQVLSEKTDVEKKDMIEKEKAIINKFKNVSLEGEALKTALESLNVSSVEVKRIMNKIEVLRGISTEDYKLLLIVFLIGIIGYYYPDFNLKLDEHINKEAYISADISRLYSVAIILSRNKEMTIRELLKWMEQFSVAFKPIFIEINESYHDQGLKVIDKLYEEMPYEKMKLLLNNIKSGENQPLDKAFKGIEQTLKAELSERNEEIEYGINFQITLSETLANAVQNMTVALYGALPVIISVYMLLNNMFNKVEGI